LGESFLEKMEIGESFFGRNHEKLAHLRNLAPKIIYGLRYRLMHGSGLLVRVYNDISHSDRVKMVPSLYFYFKAVGWGKDRWL
jgi:hypothetical protein